MRNQVQKAVNDAFDTAGAIIYLIVILFVGALVLGTLYRTSVQTTGNNSTATRTIKQELDFWSFFAQLVAFFLDWTHDVELIGLVVGVYLLFKKIIYPS